MEKFVITIGRQFGSGGLDIGRKLSENLNVKCYDKELLAMAAKESGLCQEIFENHDEKPTNSFLYSLVMDTYSVSGYTSAPFLDMPLNHKVFLAQFETIKKLADKESCIIVGRCADYALAEHSNCLNVFIHADKEFRINHIMDTFHLSHDKAADMIHKTDKKRASYYNYYSSKKWGDARSYHLTLDSSYLGLEGCCEMILHYMKLKKSQRQ
ncbi:cytidylate kinase-like family protein [Lachnospiraceae bacterium]|nr:cytidylate kinase-like family protein [Lachnospiraceae bacterium]